MTPETTLAEAEPGDEAAGTWTNASMSTCVELTADGPAGVVLKDFAAG